MLKRYFYTLLYYITIMQGVKCEFVKKFTFYGESEEGDLATAPPTPTIAQAHPPHLQGKGPSQTPKFLPPPPQLLGCCGKKAPKHMLRILKNSFE